MNTPEEIEAKALGYFLDNHPELRDVPKEKWTNQDCWCLDNAIIGVYRAQVFAQNLKERYENITNED